MSKRSTLFISLLAFYVVLQFLWWGYQIIDLGSAVDASDSESSRRVVMILGEGAVFLLILMAGFWQIQKSIRKEMELSRNKNNFMLSITHEPKTPLTSIQLALQTLSKRELDESQRRELISKAISENNRLTVLINNILSASRIENQGIIPKKINTDIKELTNKVVDEVSKRHPNEIILCDVESSILRIDLFMIETSMINLIENAIKYGGGKKIHLQGKEEQTKYSISVLDEGPGIPAEEKVNIFDKFHRVGNEETRMKKGSGLGLFITKEFVELHQGKITYRDNKPNGSVFTITLPNGK